MVRRSVGLGAAVVAIIVLVFGINSCLDSRKERAFEDYASDVRSLTQASSQISDRLFTLLSKPSRSDALDVQTQVNAERAEAEQLVQRAQGTDHPDELNDANGWLVEAFKFRADAIKRVAAQLPAALGDERDSRAAINSIAGQMQALLASDVIYLQRTIPKLSAAYEEQGISERFPTDRFLPDLGWLAPDTVETRLSRISGGASQAATPGLHGTGITGVTAQPSGTELTETGVNRVPVADRMTFDVAIQNQGESEETDVTVSVAIADGKDINVEQTVPRIAAGAEETVSIPITEKPDTQGVSNVTVEVAPVPGEGTKDNNTVKYQVAFTAG
jgi:CARDB protein